MKRIFYMLLASFFMFANNSCKEETSVIPAIDVIYAIEVNGNEVTFINQTAGAQSFRWDFGDGNESAEESPIHNYPGKGKYVPTLYALAANGETYEGSTVINIAKTSPVTIDDNSLSDWETVSDHVISPGAGGGIVNEVKMDYDGNYIYVYLDVETRVANGDIFDFYIDSDNNAGTGLLTGTFTEGGYDVLLEGPLLNGSLDVFYHTGAQTSFSFEQQSIADYYSLGTVISSGNNTQFEMRIERSKLRGLTGTALRMGIVITKSDWSAQLGSAPATGQPAHLLGMDD